MSDGLHAGNHIGGINLCDCLLVDCLLGVIFSFFKIWYLKKMLYLCTRKRETK